MKLIRISAIWCTSCLKMYQTWELLKEKYPDFEYIEYDYDFDEEEVSKFDVGTIIPVMIVLNGEEEITRIVGEHKKEEVLNIIESLVI